MVFNNPNIKQQAVNEVYFGKTPELIAIENQLDIFRNKYMNRYVFNMSVNSDSDLLKFDRMMEDFFGFGCFTLHIHNQAACNAFTLPVDYRYDYTNNGQDIIADKRGFKFKKEKDYSIILGIYSGLIFNPDFTTEEIMACILHEVGHNFNASINRPNGVLVNNWTAFSLVINIINLLYGAFNLDLIKNTNSWRKFVDKTGKELRKNKFFFIYLYDLYKQMIAITKAAEGITNDVLKVLTLGLATPICMVLNGITGFIINPIGVITQKVMQVLQLKARYSDEETADNLATMYGYGPASISLQQKFQDVPKDSSSVIMGTVNKIPIIASLIHLNELPAYILVGAFDEHPEGLIRCKDQLDMLEREVNKNDIDPKMKKVILSDIKECRKQMDKLTEKTSMFEDPYAARKAYNRLLDELSGGEFKKTIFGNSNKFEEYDKAYSNALKRESSLMEDLFL